MSKYISSKTLHITFDVEYEMVITVEENKETQQSGIVKEVELDFMSKSFIVHQMLYCKPEKESDQVKAISCDDVIIGSVHHIAPVNPKTTWTFDEPKNKFTFKVLEWWGDQKKWSNNINPNDTKDTFVTLIVEFFNYKRN